MNHPRELLAEAGSKGFVELRLGVYLNSRESLQAEQNDWDDGDKAKNLDLSVAPFWLTTSSGDGPFPILDEADLLRELTK
jgi:hypothetical protein